MNSSSIVTIALTADDYEELLSLLRTCGVASIQMSDGNSKLADLAADFRFFCDLLESSRR